MKHLMHYLAMALTCVAPTAAQASCYRVNTYYKPTYVAPTYYPPVATVYAVPIFQLFNVGPGYAYAPPPPPAAVVPAAAPVATCDQKIAALAAELKAVREENRAMMQQLIQGQQLRPQGQPAPQQQPVPQAAARKPDLSWLTGEKGCAACHSGEKAVKNIDYTKGLAELSAKHLGKTIKVLDEDSMPPPEQKEYADRGLQGPHPKVTQQQKEDFAAALAELRK